MRIKTAFSYAAVLLFVIQIGCSDKRNSPGISSASELVSEIGRDVGLDLTNNLIISNSVSWTFHSRSERISFEVTLFHIAGESALLAPLLQQIRVSPLYVSEFRNELNPDYVQRASWWSVHQKPMEFIRLFSTSNPSAASLNVYMEDNGTNINVYGESIRRKE